MDSLNIQVEQPSLNTVPQQLPNNRSKNSRLIKWSIIIISVTLLLSVGVYLGSRTRKLPKQPLTSTPTVSPSLTNNKQIAFLRTGDIWMADENGSNQKKITSNTNIEEYKWIPNTTQFVYYSVSPTETSTIDTSIVDWKTLQTKTIHEGGHGRSGLSIYYLTVSPDGKKIAYSEGLIYPDKGFIVYDIASEKEETYTKCANDPVFSQDGSQIANILWGNIIICSSPDSEPEILTSYSDPRSYKGDYSKYAYPHSLIGWSKDDQKIYYIISNIGAGNYEWTTVNNINAVNIKLHQIDKVTDYPPGQYTELLNFLPETNTIYCLNTDNIVYNSSGQKAGSEINAMYGAQFDSLGYKVSINKSVQRLDLTTQKLSELYLHDYGQFFSDTFYTVSPEGGKVLYGHTKILPEQKSQNDIWQITLSDKISSLFIENAKSPQWIY